MKQNEKRSESSQDSPKLYAGKEIDETPLVYFHPDELRTKEFNAFVDRLLTKGDASEEGFTVLTPVQRHVFSVINRAFARITRREYISEIKDEYNE